MTGIGQAFRRTANYGYFAGAFLTYLFLHHMAHYLAAKRLGVFHELIISPLVIKVVLTPGSYLSGWRLAFYSGLGCLVVMVIGYLLLFFRRSILKVRHPQTKHYLYFVTLTFLLVDPIYVSILSLVVGGDICSIAVGLNTSCAMVRAFYGAIGLFNIFLVCNYLYPDYSGQSCPFLSMVIKR